VSAGTAEDGRGLALGRLRYIQVYLYYPKKNFNMNIHEVQMQEGHQMLYIFVPGLYTGTLAARLYTGGDAAGLCVGAVAAALVIEAEAIATESVLEAHTREFYAHLE
jgi:hypothetical protein